LCGVGSMFWRMLVVVILSCGHLVMRQVLR
jgi:hypothetical protein